MRLALLYVVLPYLVDNSERPDLFLREDRRSGREGRYEEEAGGREGRRNSTWEVINEKRIRK